ncbi:site-specific integrase [Galactobacter caseinivorans]|uniref:site-specific integrase n=1 Tax=Galactobacter caseinivorans TaxID=2676123 RepID=UPI001314C693|nr:tyrosine-type recombinase/integrase [Galactobacter caseinivorans]
MWLYRLEAGTDPETGKRRRPSGGGFETRAEAEAALSEVREQIRLGTWTDDRRTTVGEYLDRWLARRADGLKTTTLDTYRGHVEKFIRPELGAVRIKELRPGHIYAMLDVVAQGRSAASVHRVRATLRSALASAVRERLISWNPARDLEMPREERSRVTPWEPRETVAFLDSVAGDRLAPYFHLVAYLGLRRGEALGLSWDDVDLVRRTITIRQSIVHAARRADEAPCVHCGAVHGGLRFDTPKTKESAGVVHLDADTVAVLLSQQLAQGEERADWGDAYLDHGLVFAREDGNPYRPTWISHRFVELQGGVTVAKDPDTPGGERRAVRRVKLHDLRHGAASMMLAAGVDIAIVSKVLRHSTIKLTVDTYTHLLPGVGEAAAEARADVLRKERSRARGQ